MHVDAIVAPEAFKAIEALWSRLRNEQTSDPDLAIGHAAFVANDDRARAGEILREAIAPLPSDAALWTELGRVAPEPSERLDALQKARVLGMWKYVEGFLIACKNFWDDEILDDWVQEVRNERIPDFE